MRVRAATIQIVIKKRCDALTTKACEISSDNASVRLQIDNLRLEKIAHKEHTTRMSQKAEKMDTDIAFLTHQVWAWACPWACPWAWPSMLIYVTHVHRADLCIAFLTHQAHQALDQREKVRGKFLMAQRDMMQVARGAICQESSNVQCMCMACVWHVYDAGDHLRPRELENIHPSPPLHVHPCA